MPPPHEASSSIATLIQRCTTVNSLKKARRLHATILTSTGARSPYANNNLLSMYAKCGSLTDARKVFDEMPQKNIVSYNAVMAAYSRSSLHAHFALSLIAQMEFERLKPNASTFTSLMQACGVIENRVMGSLLHSQVEKLGLLNDLCVQTSVLGMYSSCGDLESANRIFGVVGDKDAVTWNSMIFGNLKNGKVKHGLELFEKMVSSGVMPTQFTYSTVLNGCSKLKDHAYGQIVHARLITSNIWEDLPLQNALLGMYCNCNDFETALYVFSSIAEPDLVSWNSMITGCSENGYGEKAMDLFIKLNRLPNPKPDEYTFAAVISATGCLLASDYGNPLHAQVEKTSFGSSLFVGTTLVSMYFKNRDLESAHRVFTLISEKDVILWTEMIVGYSRMADEESAIQFFCEMYREGNKIDSFALSSALGACADLAILKQGEMIHCLAIKSGYSIEMSVSGGLIDMYAKNGNLVAAESIFSLLFNPDKKCWNSMIGAYSQHGMAEKAWMSLESILDLGIEPDQVTYLSLLSACTHSGLTEKGKILWNYMNKNGCILELKHYSCMTSLLSRAGLMDEAIELIKNSPYRDDHLELWRSLLSSCVSLRNLGIGVYAAEQVFRLDSEDSATHVLLSNLYAVTGKWDGVREMRKKIRGLMLDKDPGLSWIEGKNCVHVFSSGDQSHLEVEEAKAELLRLRGNMIKSFDFKFDSL